MRKLDYDNMAYFRMVGDSMDNGGKESIEDGTTMVCVPVKVCDLMFGDIVAVKASGKTIVGIVCNIGKGVVTLSRYNPRFGEVKTLTRLSKFFLVLETRRKRGGAYDGVLVCLKGLA